ncbi:MULTISPECIES: UDP-N-acetylglucosamine 2-epimerase [Actinokineospora]|uniref:UDP-N-acetylglucosamine 2-epimerase n=1 Tax=Actinokineospora TaxID=39845 RepID=UPI00166FD19E|nr:MULTISPECIES: UDP-N-acetylglucosamine 2-epimerase [Actinokineospora]
MATDAAAAVRLSPLALLLRGHGRVRVLLTACGPAAADTVTALGAAPDAVVPLEAASLMSAPALMSAVDRVLADSDADAVVVAGDSAIAFGAAMAAFWRRIPVVHLDAGVRSHDLTAPFPEEGHRRLIAQVASLHLTSTPAASANLAAEAHACRTVLTVGSTAVDAARLALARRKLSTFADLEDAARSGERRVALVSLDPDRHGRRALSRVLPAVSDLALATPDLEVVLPAPRGSRLRELAEDSLGRLVRVVIADALPQPDLIGLLSVAAAAVCDPGPLVEQAGALGVPTLLLSGERGAWTEPEHPGEPWTAGLDRAVIARIAEKLVLTGPRTPTPLGDGHAAARCEQAVEWLLGLSGRPEEFAG